MGESVWGVGIKKEIGGMSTSTMKCLAVAHSSAPNGQASWNDILRGMGWVFTSITAEGWVDSMYGVTQAVAWKNDGLWLLVNFVYTTMMMFGHVAILNLALAVVWDEYAKEDMAADEELEEHWKEERKRYISEGHELKEDPPILSDPLPDPWDLRLFASCTPSSHGLSLATLLRSSSSSTRAS